MNPGTFEGWFLGLSWHKRWVWQVSLSELAKEANPDPKE